MIQFGPQQRLPLFMSDNTTPDAEAPAPTPQERLQLTDEYELVRLGPGDVFVIRDHRGTVVKVLGVDPNPGETVIALLLASLAGGLVSFVLFLLLGGAL